VNDLYGSAWLFLVLQAWNSEGELLFSSKQARLAKARVAEARPGVLARTLAHAEKLSFERKTISLRRDGLA